MHKKQRLNCRFGVQIMIKYVCTCNIYIYIAYVVEWSRALDISLSDWCCSVSMVWVQIPSREEHKFIQSQEIKYIIQTFKQVTIYLSHWISKLPLLILNIIYVWKSSQTMLELDLWAVKFVFFPRLYNEFFIILYNILKLAKLDCCQIIILSIYVPSTHA
jgi:hypothetical protein